MADMNGGLYNFYDAMNQEEGLFHSGVLIIPDPLGGKPSIFNFR